MAFANLFTRLSAVEEDVKSPGRPAFTHRNETKNGRKRNTEAELTGPNKKKRWHQAQTTHNVTPDRSKATHYRTRNTGPSDTAGCDNMCHKGQNSKTTKYPHVNKQQEWKKKTEGQQNQHRQDRRRHASRDGSHQTRSTIGKGGGNRENKHDMQDFHVKRTRFMTQEFKDQNVLLVDGRLLCRHFLWGRCIKGDDCQLEHVQGCNNLVKVMCKFYVQGLCTKGESCPYMHKSFPCKFFHRKGKCSQGADCRFSHEPLNDITSELLDKELKRETDLYELAKKAEQKSSGQTMNTDESVSEIIDANTTPDVLMQPLRPNFYQSTDTNPEEAALLCQTEELADNMEEVVPPHASDAAQPHSSPSTNLHHEEPICYSVEAVLGPQLSKPFPCFFTTPGSQEFAPPSSSDCTSGSANQSQVPYSVDAVLRSFKSVEKSTFGHTPTPPTAQTVSYSPKTSFEDVTDPLLSSETQNKKLLYSSNKSQEKMFKSLSSLQVHTGLISETGLNRTLASEDHKEQSGNMPESPKPQQASQEVKFELSQLPVGITCSVESQSEGGLPFGPTQHKSIFSSLRHGTPASKHPPHISVLTFPSQPSFKPFTQFKGGAAALAQPVTSLVKSRDSANSVSHHFAAKQLTEIPLPSKKTQSGLKSATKQHYSTETTADRSNEMAHCGELAAGCKKTLKRPFHSPFASPIADTLQPTADSGTDSSCTQGVTQFLSAAPPSADCTSNHLKTAPEPCKPSASSFLSLFAAPLSAAPLPCVQPQPDHSRTDDTTHFSGSKQGASDTETALPQVRTEGREICHAPRLSNFSPDLKIGRDSSTEHIDQPAKQPVSAVSSLVSDSLSEKSTSPAPRADSLSTSHQQLPEDSSHKAATANPVLRTLFLRLGPYQQDGEQQGCTQISVPSESERRDQSGMCVFTKQQQKSKRKGSLQKKHEAPDSREQSTEKAEQQPSDRSPHISPEASGGSTLGGAGVTEPQGTDSDTHSSPLNPAVPLKQHHTQPRLKHTSEKGKRVSGSMAVTPLKDLFKTLDTAVFHCGH